MEALLPKDAPDSLKSLKAHRSNFGFSSLRSLGIGSLRCIKPFSGSSSITSSITTVPPHLDIAQTTHLAPSFTDFANLKAQPLQCL